ncbi:sulfite exporter TauE/SafE family protein [Roseivivax sediminis]|uniref:Probable membrane transporter protein n=1 Tax=Roseivivax sediminis TaxID=936889 RepID=A0A1I1YED2_9RHOB|nr:sulfite exporter TauE/SafE family protein [Roseivivax sediminis]SFE17934.1 hypothetical protein SAMN04515678_10710 [Roseivivax sediminis]
MPDLLRQLLELPGLGWILATTFVAGGVYGFAGFGSALIFMPVAAALVPPEIAVAAFSVSAASSLVTVVPRALRDADTRGLAVMIAGAVLAAPAGLWVLRRGDVEALRWGVVLVAAVTLAALVSGWRHALRPGVAARAGIGAATGFVGGATGLMGPVMILFQLSGRDSAARNRATVLVFLTFTTALLLPLMTLQGMLTPRAVLLGLAMTVPYGLGARLGAWLFQPDREGLYRTAAYVIIAIAIAAGLPVRD